MSNPTHKQLLVTVCSGGKSAFARDHGELGCVCERGREPTAFCSLISTGLFCKPVQKKPNFMVEREFTSITVLHPLIPAAESQGRRFPLSLISKQFESTSEKLISIYKGGLTIPADKVADLDGRRRSGYRRGWCCCLPTQQQ